MATKITRSDLTLTPTTSKFTGETFEARAKDAILPAFYVVKRGDGIYRGYTSLGACLAIHRSDSLDGLMDKMVRWSNIPSIWV